MIGDLIKKLFGTRAGFLTSVVRIYIGLIFFRAGTGKLFQWFGGPGPQNFGLFLKSMGLPFPEFQAYLVGSTETLCGLALLGGLLTRLASLPLMIVMLTAIFTAHKDGDFYYPLLILLCCLSFVQSGSGTFSIDKLISRKLSS